MKYVAGFLVLVFVLLWIPVGINRILDEKPNPEIAGFIAQSPVTVPESAVRAYQYWLAIRVLGEMLIERWKKLQESHARLSSPFKI